MSASTLRSLFTWRSAVVESNLSPTTRHVALTLSLHMNERGGSCFPAQQTLADETGLNIQTVATHLKRLEESGWLTKTITRKGKGRGTRVEYESRVPDAVSTYTEDTGAQVLVPDDHPCPDQTTTYTHDTRPPIPTTQVSNSSGVLHGEDSVANATADAEAPANEQGVPVVGIEAAKKIVRWYWDGVKDRTGKPPAGIRFMALAKVVEPFLKHWEPDEVRPALRAMYDAGQTITGQNLEKQLDGRAKKFGRSPAHDRQMAVMRFDPVTEDVLD